MEPREFCFPRRLQMILPFPEPGSDCEEETAFRQTDPETFGYDLISSI